MENRLAPEQKKIVSAIAGGNFYTVACTLAGIDLGTFYHWMQQGKEGTDETCQVFFQEVKRAEAMAEARRLQVIVEASETNWRAAQWLLEKRFPHKWGPSRNRSDAQQTRQDREVTLAFDLRAKTRYPDGRGGEGPSSKR